MCDISDPSPSTKHHGDCPHLGRIGDQCAVTCNHGYLPGAGMRPFTCSADGKWVGGHVNCTAVKCPAEHDSDMSWDSDMENPGDNVTCAEGSYDPTDPSVCRVDACRPGYVPAPGKSNGDLICTADGTWMPGPGFNFECVKRTCPASDPSLSTKHHGGCPLGHFGDKCAVACDQGYLPNPHNTPFTCSADGKWVGGHVNCTKATCDISDPSPSTKHHGDCPHLGRIGDQ